MENWFEQLLLHSSRDQLSFNVVAWLHDFVPEHIALNFADNDLLEWPVLPAGAIRIPRDFNDARYLTLYPDVEAARMNPRKHYLRHGAAEGRPYK
jgi:hypothetical protein